jgi:predicted transcriptional regulator
MPKTLTIRITDEQADEAELTARIQDSSVSALIRNAIDLYLKTCRNDPTFQRRLRASLVKQQEVTARLSNVERTAP